jgi:transcriptional regulator with XRE-family HTH domain
VLAGEMDGVEAARRIRTQRETPIVFVTAHADGTTFGRARRTAPDGYVLKPFADFDLRAAIEIAFERRRATQAANAASARAPPGRSRVATDGDRLPREFGARVRALRRVRDLTQAELAKRSALSVDGVRRLERGAYSPSLATLMRLANGLGVTLQQLLAPHAEFTSVEDVVAFLRDRPDDEVLWAGGILRALFHR